MHLFPTFKANLRSSRSVQPHVQVNSVRNTAHICILFATLQPAWGMPRPKFCIFKGSSVSSVQPFIITS